MQKLDQFILPLVLLSVLAIKAGNAIECYNCDSSVDEDCNDVSKSLKLKPVICNPSVIGKDVGDWLKEVTKIDFFETPDVSVPMLCQKIIGKNAEGNRITYRGCQLDGGKSDVCTIAMTKAKNVNVEIEDCKICMEDACNKSPTSHVNLWVVFVSLIIIKAFV